MLTLKHVAWILLSLKEGLRVLRLRCAYVIAHLFIVKSGIVNLHCEMGPVAEILSRKYLTIEHRHVACGWYPRTRMQ